MSSTDSVHADLPEAASVVHVARENRNTALQGHCFRRCGQSAHNPLKHVGHAIKEVFESFWHPDERIFRTQRDLPVSGRITFFIGKLCVYVDDIRMGGSDSLYAKATTVGQVEAARSQQLMIAPQQARACSHHPPMAVCTAVAGSPGPSAVDAATRVQQ